MKTYIVTRQIRLEVEAKNRNEAIKRSQDWEGAGGMYSTAKGTITWNYKSKIISAKIKK